MDRLTEAYAAPPPAGSGVDWDTLFKVVVDRYADRLEMVRYVLNGTSSSSSDDDDALVTAKNAITHFRVMLAPYILRAVVPVPDTAWAAPVYNFCATSHTGNIRRSARAGTFTAAERLLLGAVEETNREICRVVVRLWAEGVSAGLDDALPVPVPVEAAPDVDAPALVRKWKAAIDDLMAWLDWSVWIKCRPGCSFEVCPSSMYLRSDELTARTAGNMLFADLAIRWSWRVPSWRSARTPSRLGRRRRLSAAPASMCATI
jgi:hypothetical protein